MAVHRAKKAKIAKNTNGYELNLLAKAAPNKSLHPTRASLPLINLVSCDVACVLSWRGRVNSSVGPLRVRRDKYA